MGVISIKGQIMRFHWLPSANRWPRVAFQALAIALIAAGSGRAQAPSGAGQVVTPESSTPKPGDTGVRAHTNIQIFIPNRGADGAQAPPGSSSGSPDAAASRSQQTPAANRPASPAQQ